MNAHVPIAPDAPQHELLCASFNQDNGCFVIGHEHGFRVYNTDPLDLRVRRDFADGGIGQVEMLHRTNYIGLVGGGRNPKFPQNKLVIWDDLKSRPALALEFLSPVLNILLSRTRIVAVLKNKVHVYAFSSPPTRIAVYDTADNPHGVGVLVNNILAIPGPTIGRIQIINLNTDVINSNNSSLSSASPINVSMIKAHKAGIRCLALDPSGNVLASASETGTIIRIHSTENTALLHEVRRGLDRAVIYSMAFSRNATRLAVLSDKSTLHVFDMVPNTNSVNRKHVLGKVPLMPRYFSSEWSFVSAHTNCSQCGIIGWPTDDCIIVIWLAACRWEKYVIVEREFLNQDRKSPEPQFELAREAWRGFEGLSYD